MNREIRKWHVAISWDNPFPADSSAMLRALERLGKVTRLQTKTTVLLTRNRHVSPTRFRTAITGNLHPAKGNAMYVNLRSGKTFSVGFEDLASLARSQLDRRSAQTEPGQKSLGD